MIYLPSMFAFTGLYYYTDFLFRQLVVGQAWMLQFVCDVDGWLE